MHVIRGLCGYKVDSTVQLEVGMTKALQLVISIAILIFLSGPAFAQHHEAYIMHEKGLELMEKGMYKESIPYFDGAIHLDPNMDTAYMNRGSAYDEIGNVEQALADYDKALSLNPNLGPVYFNRGLTRMRMANYDDALADLNTSIKLRPTHARSYIIRGYCYLSMDNGSQALADFEKALVLEPNERMAMEGKAKALELVGKTAEGKSEMERAESMPESKYIAPSHRAQTPKQRYEDDKRTAAVQLIRFNQSLKLNPNNADALEQRCDVNCRLGNWTKCIADANKTLQLNPSCTSVYKSRAEAYVHLKEYDKALKDLNKALSLKPNSGLLLILRGGCHHNLGKYPEAIADFTQAIKLNPHDTTTYFVRGFSYMSNNQMDNAIGDFTKWVNAHPNSANAYLTRSNAYLRAGQYDKAAADCDHAISLNPNESGAYSIRGDIALRQGHPEEAVAFLTKSLNEHVTTKQLLVDRSQAYRQLKKHSEELQDLTRAISLDSKDAQLYGLRASCYIDLQKFNDAMADTEKAYALNPKNILYLLLQAEIKAKQNDNDTALPIYNKAVQLAPNDPTVYEARARFNRTRNPNLLEPDVEKALSLNKNPSIPLMLLAADVQMAKKQYKEAIRYYDLVLKQQPPEQWVVWFLKAQAERADKNYQAALDSWNKVVEHGPQDADMYAGRAEALLVLDRKEEAEKDLDKSISIKPTTNAWALKALISLNGRNYNQAITEATSAINLDAKNIRAYHLRAVAYNQDNQSEKALSDIEVALKANPKHAKVILTYAHILETLSRFDESLKEYNAADALQPNDVELYAQRSTAFFKAGKYPECLKDALAFCEQTQWKAELCPFEALLGYFSSQKTSDKEPGKLLLEKAASNAKGLEPWPQPIIAYAQNKLSEKDLLALAKNTDKLTEARTYIGLNKELSGNKKSAIDNFLWVKEHGNTHFIEYGIALTELAKLQPANK